MLTEWVSRGATSPVGLSVCLSMQPWHRMTLHALPTPQIREPVPQVLIQVVSLSCYIWFESVNFVHDWISAKKRLSNLQSLFGNSFSVFLTTPITKLQQKLSSLNNGLVEYDINWCKFFVILCIVVFCCYFLPVKKWTLSLRFMIKNCM